MIKIIKDGQTDFIAKCSTCGCEFSYQLVDIGLNSVVCPCCGGYVAHKEFKELLPATTMRATPCKANSKNVDALQLIHDLCIDYDGFGTVEGLKSLIDEVREIAKKELSGDRGVK